MYSLILKMQLKRIWIIYLIISLIFIGGFLFVPYIFILNIFNLFFFAIMAGIALALSYWSFPKSYIVSLPIGTTKYRMALHVTPLILTVLPTLFLIICYASGIKGIILGKIYGNELFNNFKYLQTELLFLGLLFQITVLQATYFLANSYEYNWVRQVNKMKNLGIYAMLNSYGIGFFLLMLFSFSEISILLPALAVILVSSLFLPYIDPFKREILQDSHITGGTYIPDKTRLLQYSLIWGIIIFCIILLALSSILKLLDLCIVTKNIFPFFFPLIPLLYVALFMNTFTRERGAGNSILKSSVSGLCVSIFPPLLPFVYLYRLRNTTRLKALMDKYYKKHGPIQNGQIIDYKEIYKSQKKTIFIFILIGIFIGVFVTNNSIMAVNNKEKELTSVESNPSGLMLNFHDEKTNETVSIKTPAEIDAKTTDKKSANAEGYKLIEERRSYFPRKRVLDFVTDAQFEVLFKTLKSIKEAGKNRVTIIGEIPKDELFTMIRFFNGEYSSENDKSMTVYKIYFTKSEYGNILDTMVKSYTDKLSEEEASALLMKLKKERALQGNTISMWPDDSPKYIFKFYQSVFVRFKNLKNKYEKEITTYPFQIIGFRNIWENFLFEVFTEYPDNALTQLAFMNISRPTWGALDRNTISWEYLFQHQKNHKDYKFIAEAAIIRSRSMKSYYHPLEFIASSGSPQALEEIKKRLPKSMKKKEYSPDELYQVIVNSYQPEIAFDFLNSIEHAPKTRDRALCFLKTGKVTDYFMKRTDEILKDKTLLARIGAAQNEYLFPVLGNISKEQKNFTEKITSSVCRFDGILTEKWVDYIRKEGDGKAKDFLEKTLKENASCFQMKHGTQN